MKRVALPIACLLLGALATSTSVAHAQAVAPHTTSPSQGREAEAHAAKGASLVKKRKTADALAEYEQAYALGQDPKHLLIVAKLRTQTEDTAGAARAYTEYLKKTTDAQHHGEAMGELQRLLSGIGRVSVRCDQPGVSIAIDGAPMTTTPVVEPILVSPGPHTLTATKAGFATVTRSLNAKAEDTLAIAFDMSNASAEPVAAELPPVAKPVVVAPPVAPPTLAPPAPAAAPAVAHAPMPASPPPAAPGSGGSSRWIGWTSAGVLAAGAVVTGIVASGEASTFADKKQTLGVTRGELEDAQTSARTWTLVSAGLGVAAVGVLTITLLSSKSTPVTVGASPDAVRLSGKF